MTRISMKALLGAGSLAVIAAISLTPAVQAQEQPGAMSPTGQPATTAPAPQQYPPQNAYAPPTQEQTPPSQLQQSNPRYPGPKLN
jgi:hypothetical protein